MSLYGEHFAEVTRDRFGYRIQVCQCTSNVPGPGIYRAIGAYRAQLVESADDHGGIESGYIVTDVDAPRWRPTERWAHRLARHLIRRHEATAAREDARTVVESSRVTTRSTSTFFERTRTTR